MTFSASELCAKESDASASTAAAPLENAILRLIDFLAAVRTALRPKPEEWTTARLGSSRSRRLAAAAARCRLRGHPSTWGTRIVQALPSSGCWGLALLPDRDGCVGMR